MYFIYRMLETEFINNLRFERYSSSKYVTGSEFSIFTGEFRRTGCGQALQKAALTRSELKLFGGLNYIET